MCSWASGCESRAAGASLTNSSKVRGFSVPDHVLEHASARKALHELADAGKLRQIETIDDVLALAPDALVGLLRGTLAGKVIVACRRAPAHARSAGAGDGGGVTCPGV